MYYSLILYRGVFLKKAILLIAVLFCSIISNNAKAAENINFTLEIVYPENQLEDNAGYFYITYQPNQKLEVKLTNTSSKEISSQHRNSLMLHFPYRRFSIYKGKSK